MITGSNGMAGAACLAAMAAYTAGAGLVQIYTPADNRVILQQLLPEAICQAITAMMRKKLDELLEWADVVLYRFRAWDWRDLAR
ncbi:MAG: NAD(P)H-hydrate dehydratase [Lachnoclostridium sp.]